MSSIIFKLKFVLELNSKEYIIHMTSQGIKVDLTSPRMAILRQMINILSLTLRNWNLGDSYSLLDWGENWNPCLWHPRPLRSVEFLGIEALNLISLRAFFSFFLRLSCNHKALWFSSLFSDLFRAPENKNPPKIGVFRNCFNFDIQRFSFEFLSSLWPCGTEWVFSLVEFDIGKI